MGSCFNGQAGLLFDEQDRAQGGIVGEDRRGTRQMFGLTTVAIGAVCVPPGPCGFRNVSRDWLHRSGFAKGRWRCVCPERIAGSCGVDDTVRRQGCVHGSPGKWLACCSSLTAALTLLMPPSCLAAACWMDWVDWLMPRIAVAILSMA